MKHFLCLLAFIVFACKHQTSQDNIAFVNDTIKQDTVKKFDRSKYYTSKDTLRIITERGDTLMYTKNEFNRLVDTHPELTDDYPQNPDFAYHCFADKDEFGSELGQDNYYELYAYFLRQKNSVNKYAVQRKTLIDIYTGINSLFRRLQYGGTYFGHQYSRISGYAEYSVYLYKTGEQSFSKTYAIAKQKKLYIESLRQLIEDEGQIDFETLPQNKAARNQELNAIIDTLDKTITNIFYLRRAQEFHYHYYEYY